MGISSTVYRVSISCDVKLEKETGVTPAIARVALTVTSSPSSTVGTIKIVICGRILVVMVLYPINEKDISDPSLTVRKNEPVSSEVVPNCPTTILTPAKGCWDS